MMASLHMKNMDGAVCPSYHLKLKYTLPFSVSYVQLVYSSMIEELFGKHLHNQDSHYEK